MSQTWMIVSGKGGVGKSMLTSAMGIALAKRKMGCCCVDMDIGLRNLDMLLGMQNKVVYDVLDVARKDCKLKYALIEHPLHSHLSLLPASISFGAVFMIIVDTVARSASAQEIPISILTAIIGAPFFIILMRRSGGWSL